MWWHLSIPVKTSQPQDNEMKEIWKEKQEQDQSGLAHYSAENLLKQNGTPNA